MTAPTERRTPEAQADELVRDILKAAAGWAREAPLALQPPVRAVTIRLGEMVADQRNYFALASEAVAEGLEAQLATLTELELTSTSSWALVPSAQGEWVNTAVTYLERCAHEVQAGQQPDPYWADDVVAGVIASVRAVLGIDELHARTESQYPGGRRTTGEQQVVEEE
jgi:hypothetical protein